MEKLVIPEMDIPALYIVDDDSDIKRCRDAYLPYIVWHESKWSLLVRILVPMAERLFPSINWRKQFGLPTGKLETIVIVPGGDASGSTREPGFMEDHGISDMADTLREFSDVDNSEVEMEMEISFDKFIGEACRVKVETLKALNMLPEFMGDIVDSINSNLIGAQWWEGYNKKLDACIGNMDAGGKALPNLIILDISGSIPRGVSNTMLQLAETMVNTAKADFIVTASKSFYYEWGEKLPTPGQMRAMNDLGNESSMFQKILNDLSDKRYGTVICFGDNDCPGQIETDIQCEKILAYHTWQYRLPGYVIAIADANKHADLTIDTDWVEWME